MFIRDRSIDTAGGMPGLIRDRRDAAASAFVRLLYIALASGLALPLAAQGRPQSTAPASTSRPVTPPAPAPMSRAAAAAALARAGDAVVTIIAYRDGTSDVTSGIGLRVSDGRVVTSLRHLRGASRAEVFGAEGDLLATVNTLEQADVKLDLAVLPRIASPGARLVLSRRSVVLNQKVSLLGPRKGTARVVLERTITRIEPDAQGRLLLRLGAAVTGSAAGSPVVNVRSELVGVALGTIAGRGDGDIAIDVSAVRELLARSAARLGFPARDGSIAAALATADTKAPVAADAATRPRSSIFPERYGTRLGADTAGQFVVEHYGCARLESRQRIYCYLRVTNLAQRANFGVKGGDLADSARRKLVVAQNLIAGETVQRVAGWRKKAEIPLRELESARIALEFALPARDSRATRLMVDVAGEKPVWFGPFLLQRAP
ncbi:MAG: hypothetical protein H7305_09900 [Gemmatimonadaceae bacterium]|nr:hypothetical protein [Gemmatimonadaceae bacterium]